MKFLPAVAIIGTWALGTLVSGALVESTVNTIVERAEGKHTAFPGVAWFKSKPSGAVIASMGKRLVAEGCSAYKEGPGKQWTDADRDSYRKWQQKLGYKGKDADGWPGKTSWDKLKVPGKGKGGGGGDGSGRGRANKEAVDMMKQWEGFKPNFYDDGVGYKTIGYGHNCDAKKDCGKINAPITKKEATKLFRKDIRQFEKCVCGLPNASGLNENQFGALVSFAYNYGCGGVSNYWKGAMKKKNFKGICEALPNTSTLPGKPVHQGLLNRRKAEGELCGSATKTKSGC